MSEILNCPKCGHQLIRTNIVVDKEVGPVIVAYTCFTIECREGKLEAPIFYGNTQKDIDNNIVK